MKRFVPLAILACLAGLAFAFDLHQYLTIDTLRDQRLTLQAYVAENLVAAALAFAAAYAAVVALSLPGATIMTVAGGFLFGTLAGGALAVVSATVGAALVFLAARTVIGDWLKTRAGPFLRRMEEGFHANAFHYLLFLRLVPAFPFWAVNLVPALVGVPLRTFVGATALGIIPGTFVFAAFGAGIGDVFDTGGEVRLADALNPTLLAALVGLGLLALLPVLLRQRRNR